MRFFGNHMILQSECANKVFGTAPPKQTVTLTTINSHNAKGTIYVQSDANGKWELIIPPYCSSFEPYTLEFSCAGQSIIFTDVLFGELYHISGQSNMEMQLINTIDPLKEEIPPKNGYIREFRVPIKCCFGKSEEYDDFQGGEWMTAEDDNYLQISAVGYYFAKSLFETLNVPIGLVNSSAGGSPIEARLPYEILSELGGYEEFLSQCTVHDYENNTAKSDRLKYKKWSDRLEQQDEISSQIFSHDTGFKKCVVPFYFRDEPALKDFCGRVWLRKSFEIPQELPLEDAFLILGVLIDADRAYVNGVFVGATDYMYPARIYRIPANILRHGENTIHIQLEVRQGHGGFVKGKNYCIKLADKRIELSGEWEYAIAAQAEYLQPDVFFQGLPLSMYGALTAPAFNIRFRGLVWYQGESNDRNPERYYELFKTFAEMYRLRSGYDIPIIFTQLCNFDDPVQAVPPFSWAEVREQQRKCLAVPNTAMAVTIDIGEENDIHPKNKRDVGYRLAQCASRLIYGDSAVPENIECTSAELISAENTRVAVLLRFSDNSAVRMVNIPPKHFEFVLENGSISAATGYRTKDGILLESGLSEPPQAVRYAWKNNPANPDLFGQGGIPLSPFIIKITDKDV